MIYTMKTVGMGLDTARRVMAYPEQHSAEQKARALVVVSYWNKRRSKQKAKSQVNQ